MYIQIFLLFSFENSKTTLMSETFTGRNFRGFREFWVFSRKFIPAKNIF